jgi:hypothetical protein
MNIWEEPLLGWGDVGVSKLSGRQYFTVLRDIQQFNSYPRKKPNQIKVDLSQTSQLLRLN